MRLPKPPRRTASYISVIMSSYLSIMLLSRIICVLAVRAPPGMGDQMISGLVAMAAGGRK